MAVVVMVVMMMPVPISAMNMAAVIVATGKCGNGNDGKRKKDVLQVSHVILNECAWACCRNSRHATAVSDSRASHQLDASV
jgi:hypothetical protein